MNNPGRRFYDDYYVDGHKYFAVDYILHTGYSHSGRWKLVDYAQLS